MKILVLSDSHSALSCMRRYILAVKPDAVVHLGDYYEDGQIMAEEFPHIPFHLVPGYCDRYRMFGSIPEILCYDIFGVRLYMTHGHKHLVKQTLVRLLADARANQAAAVLFGHTHIPCCYQEDDMWVMNPGPSTFCAGIVEIENKKITSCRLLPQEEMEVSL